MDTELFSIRQQVKQTKETRKREAELRARDKELAERMEKEAHLNSYKTRWAKKQGKFNHARINK